MITDIFPEAEIQRLEHIVRDYTSRLKPEDGAHLQESLNYALNNYRTDSANVSGLVFLTLFLAFRNELLMYPEPDTLEQPFQFPMLPKPH